MATLHVAGAFALLRGLYPAEGVDTLTMRLAATGSS